MELIWQPQSPWWQVALAAWVALVLGLGWSMARGRAYFGPASGTPRWPLAAWCAMGGAFFLATLDPQLRPRASRQASAELAVVLDVSHSVLRGAGGLSGLAESVAARLAEALAKVRPEDRALLAARLVVVAGGARVEGAAESPERLIARLRQLREERLPRGDGSDLAAGLDAALRALSGQAGDVLLVSDGHATAGDVLAVAARSGAQGRAVHVWPRDGTAEALRVRAVDLPAQAAQGAAITLRALIENNSAAPLKLALGTIVHARGAAPRVSEMRTRELAPRQLMAWTEPVVFADDGVQAVDLVIAAGEQRIVRRFFCHVQRPPRLLSVGGDFAWAGALRDMEIEIVSAAPGEVGQRPELDPRRFDVVALSEVPAGALAPGAAADIAAAVREQATGLLVLNGTHRGRQPEDLSVLGTYARSPLDEVLPVTAEPRAFEVPPPARQMVLMMDTSGSMTGAPLELAKAIGREIVAKLRPQDELEIIVFTTNPRRVLSARAMDDRGKRAAEQALAALQAGGGTDPTPALAMIRHRTLKNGGLIFISDGEFEASHLNHPDLTTIVFAIGAGGRSIDNLRRLADYPILVGGDFNPAGIRIPYFEPERRSRFFEPGEFVPRAVYRGLAAQDQWPIPALPLEGTAATVAKAWATPIGWRDRPKERVLVLGEAGLGRVAVLTSQIPPAWVAQPEGRAAVQEWVQRLLPLRDRNRHRVRVHDRGDSLELAVALTAPADRPLPQVQGMSVELLSGSRSLGTPRMRPVEAAPAEFAGVVAPPRGPQAQEALLALREIEGGGTQSARQLIRFSLPPQGAVATTLATEDWSDGRNVPLLRALAERGGGRYDETAVWPPVGAPPPAPPRHLWPWLVIAGLGCQLLVAALRQLAR